MKWPSLLRRKSSITLPVPAGNGGWFSILRESYSGAWQQGVTDISYEAALAYSAVFSCITLIAADVAKLPIQFMKQDGNGVWKEANNAIPQAIKRPNHYQNRIQFIEHWLSSKLSRGNTYVLKVRDQNYRVSSLYVLDPTRVTPLVAPNGEIFYQLNEDNLTGLKAGVTVPSTEIIHDRSTPLFHPLVGTPPLFACGLAALQGLNIQKNSANFFGNMSRPSGILSAPGSITDEVAGRLKTYWEEEFSGSKIGRVAVLGDALKYEAMTINANDAQLVEQLKWSAQDVCSCFHVPAHKVGFAPAPTYNNSEILNLNYYTDCLQTLIESIELCLKEGLDIPDGYRVEVGVDYLLRMDTQARYKAHSDAISGGWMAPNEARRRENLAPVDGGDTPYLQQQNYSLAALARRDKREMNPPPAPAVITPPAEVTLAAFRENFRKALYNEAT